MSRKRLHAPEISATLRLRYSLICSCVSFVVNGAGTSTISEAMVVVCGCTVRGVGVLRDRQEGRSGGRAAEGPSPSAAFIPVLSGRRPPNTFYHTGRSVDIDRFSRSRHSSSSPPPCRPLCAVSGHKCQPVGGEHAKIEIATFDKADQNVFK